jgi:ribosomal protein S18 acetylase RimI-like enzyme
MKPNKPVLEIRSMARSDLPKVIGIVDQVFNVPDRTAAEKELQYHFECKAAGIHDGYRYWVALAKGRLVGVIGLEHVTQETCWLSWFAVRKHAEHKGIGTHLLKYAVSESRRMGAKTMCVQCGSLPMFRVANAMYRKFGFVERFRMKDYWSKGDDLVIMSRRI